MSLARRERSANGGFTLVELLVVIGIIALLISILMPALSRARRQSEMVQCRANLKQCFLFMVMYANDNRGLMFPTGLGANREPEKRWPVHVFKPPQWNPPVMRCPSDIDPVFEHSYVVNNHFERHQIRYHNTKGVSPATVIVMGEKKTDVRDYYMDLGDFDRVVEMFRHGFFNGSNYLFMDGHVESQLPKNAKGGVDPWDPTVPTTPHD